MTPASASRKHTPMSWTLTLTFPPKRPKTDRLSLRNCAQGQNDSAESRPIMRDHKAQNVPFLSYGGKRSALRNTGYVTFGFVHSYLCLQLGWCVLAARRPRADFGRTRPSGRLFALFLVFNGEQGNEIQWEAYHCGVGVMLTTCQNKIRFPIDQRPREPLFLAVG